MNTNLSEKKALLVIDMQKGSFTPKTPRFDTDGVTARINKLADLFRQNDWPVIFIQHDGTRENIFIPNTEEWELLDGIEALPDDQYVSKIANDCFYHSDLKNVIKQQQVKELYFTGCATDFCVEATIQSAVAKDYHITVVSDGHTTGERPKLTAKQVIDHYNWTWQNMIPTKGSLRVKSSKEIVN